MSLRKESPEPSFQALLHQNLTLPNGHDSPSESPQRFLGPRVSPFVSLEFRGPEIDSSLGSRSPSAAFMPMPETSVNKYHASQSREDEVWRSWEVSAMNAIPIAERVNSPPNNHLGDSVFASDRAHHS